MQFLRILGLTCGLLWGLLCSLSSSFELDRAKGQSVNETRSVVPSEPQPGAHKTVPAYIDADSFVQDTNTGVVIARGDVVFTQGDIEIYADEIRYSESEDFILARGNVAAQLPGEGVLFAAEVKLANGQEQGYAIDVQWQLPRGQTATAERLDIVDGNYILNGATFTSCALCDNETAAALSDHTLSGDDKAKRPTRNRAQSAPVWQFSAPKGYQSGDRISYNWPYLSLRGVPVVVTPYFSHISGSIRRAPGLLTPEIGSSTLLGTYTTFQGYTPINETSDLIVYATPASGSASQAGGTYRQSISGGHFKIGGSYAPTFQKHLKSIGVTDGLIDGKNESWHISASGTKQLSRSLKIGANWLRASDSNYVRAYRIGGSLLTSRTYLEYLQRRDYWLVEGIAFQDFRSVGSEEKAPLVLPRFTSEIYGRSGQILGGTPYGQLDLLTLFREQDQDTAFVSGRVGWHRHLGTHYGLQITSHSWGRLDQYLTDYDASSNENDPLQTVGTVSEGRSQVASVLNIEAPLTLGTTRTPAGPVMQSLTPGLKLRVSNRVSRSDIIPNNDNTIVELDDQTLLQDNWYPGLDRIDDINRVVGSMTHAAYSGQRFNWTSTLSAARTLEAYDYEELANTGLLENGRAQRETPIYFGTHISAPLGFEIDYRTVMTDQTHLIWFQDFGISQTRPTYDWNILMSEASRGPGQEAVGELQTSANARLFGNIEISGQVRQRLYGEEERLRKVQSKLTYIHPCFEIGLAYTQTWSSSLDDFDREWLITGSLKNLGN